MFKKLFRLTMNVFTLGGLFMALVGWYTFFREIRDVFLDRMRAKRS
jgi:hypothetical protein